mgnify:CR=1 FL=1
MVRCSAIVDLADEYGNEPPKMCDLCFYKDECPIYLLCKKFFHQLIKMAQELKELEEQ